MELKINNNTDDDDALSLRDLQLYDQTATEDDYALSTSPRTSSGHELFEFLPNLSNPTATGEIVFCGKVISDPVDDVNAHARRIVGSASLRLPERRIDHVVPMRSVSVSCRDTGSPRFWTTVKKVNVTAAPAKSKRRMFTLGPVRFVPEMEMSSIRERQGRRTPSRMFPVAEGGDARETVTDAGTDKNQRVKCRARLNSVLERSLACLRI